jgi:acetylornithine deacetylase/succinyl-diaminopimelate desuccinylase-like protein
MRFVIALSLLLVATTWAQTPPAVKAAREYRQQHEREILIEFMDLLALPNVASDLPNIRRNAAAIQQMFERRGVRMQLLEVPDVPPVVYGEINVPNATKTLIVYAHYDGQPVEPQKWVGGEPFKPVLRTAMIEAGGKEIPLPAPGEKIDPEWRLYARSSGDDKTPIIALCAALDAMRANKITPSSNIKFFFEGEEEAGSANLGRILEKYKDQLKGDVWLICDGPVDQSRQQALAFGARGVTSVDVTVYGPRRELHSGHYGNWAPNPAMLLAQLLASMKDADGRVTIAHYNDGAMPLSASEIKAIQEAPRNEEMLKRELGLARVEGGGQRLAELYNLPSLNVRGLSSASVGATARNVVPAFATAALDIRLVKGIDYRVAVDRLVAHIRAQGYHVIETEPDDATRLKYPKIARVARHGGYNAVRVSMDTPMARAVIAAVESARGKVVKQPTMGGSVPLFYFDEILHTPTIIVPMANHDNNQHSANENLRLQNLWDGIETMAALLTGVK